MKEANDALSKTAESDTLSTYQVSSVQLVTDNKLEAHLGVMRLRRVLTDHPLQWT